MPPNPDKRPCPALTRAGQPCTNWARRGSARCAVHDRPPEAAIPAARRCTATTTGGAQCRNWALRAAPGPPLCHVHAGLSRPTLADPRRCRARLPDGQRCTQWALPHADPPLCLAHHRNAPLPGDKRRCMARTATGKRCRKWATLASRAAGRPRCAAHSHDRQRPPPTGAQRCTAATRAGQPCRAWAMPAADPPRCAAHHLPPRVSLPTPADRQAGRVCTALTLAGDPCRRWAIARTHPPLCSLHAYPGAHGRLRHHYYRRTPFLPPAVLDQMNALRANGPPLSAEIVLARWQVAALLAYLAQPGLPPAGQLPAYPLLNRALRAVARLIRTQHALLHEA
jgi:hypothetical protein